MFDFYNSSNEKKASEKYLVVIGDIQNFKLFYVLVPSRKAFSELLANLSSEKYTVSQINLLNDVKDFDEFMKELKQKPDDLNFG